MCCGMHFVGETCPTCGEATFYVVPEDPPETPVAIERPRKGQGRR